VNIRENIIRQMMKADKNIRCPLRLGKITASPGSDLTPGVHSSFFPRLLWDDF
jgi:hypothetical protein